MDSECLRCIPMKLEYITISLRPTNAKCHLVVDEIPSMPSSTVFVTCSDKTAF